MPDNPIYLTPQQVAVRWECSVRTIYRYLWRGEFPNAKRRLVGWLIPENDLDEFLNRWTPRR